MWTGVFFFVSDYAKHFSTHTGALQDYPSTPIWRKSTDKTSYARGLFAQTNASRKPRGWIPCVHRTEHNQSGVWSLSQCGSPRRLDIRSSATTFCTMVDVWIAC